MKTAAVEMRRARGALLIGALAAASLAWSSAAQAQAPPPIATPFWRGAPPETPPAPSNRRAQALAAEPAELFILERTPELLRDVGLGNVDLNEHTIAQAFFASQPDRFDHLVIFTDFPVALAANPQTAGLYVPVSSAVTGINVGLGGRFEEVFDFSQNYGSAGRLRGVILLGNAAVMPLDPGDRSYNDGYAPLNLLGQETAHQFGAFVTYRDDEGIQRDLLGRAQAHWSYFFHSGGSDLEGNRWAEAPEGRFTSASYGGRFNQLDHYLMGLRLPSQVTEPLFVIKDAAGIDPASVSAQAAPREGATAQGRRVPVSVEQVIDAHGPRLPSAAASPHTFSQAFILITDPAGLRREDALARIEALRRAWPSYFYAATDERGRLLATLDGADELLRFGFGAGPEGFTAAGGAMTSTLEAPLPTLQAAEDVVRFEREGLRASLERVAFLRVDLAVEGVEAPCGVEGAALLGLGDGAAPVALPLRVAADGQRHTYTLPLPASARSSALTSLGVELGVGRGGRVILHRVEGLDVPTLRDRDEDGVLDAFDDCPSDADPLQGDHDGDGIGDVCDSDPGAGVLACAPPAADAPACACSAPGRAAPRGPWSAALLLAGLLWTARRAALRRAR